MVSSFFLYNTRYNSRSVKIFTDKVEYAVAIVTDRIVYLHITTINS